MTLRAIVATPEDATAIAARVDAAHGYPRCERLAGRVVHVGGGTHVTACPCTDPSAPQRGCLLATRREAAPVRLRDGTVAYPVREALPETVAALTPAERSAIVTVDPRDVDPDAPAPADTKPTGGR